ncbi:MAG: hypothetical protein SWO11_20410 [Thermodesulfobacteriota bacterium]|nr:hypothetical protein [Thermodesulfobacteriota bacterium]
MFDNPWFQNVLSEFIALGIIFLVGVIIYWSVGRRKLLNFFGLKSQKRIILYLSNIRVTRGGSIGVDNTPRAFSGDAIAANEARLIPYFQRLFNFIVPQVKSLPGFLKFLLLSDISADFLLSPLQSGDVERSSTFIAVGSPGYNKASQHIEEAFHPIAKFTDDNASFVLQDVPPITDLKTSFVQRVFNQATGQTAFYVAGMSPLGTNGAMYFLITRWDYLVKKYPENTPFCVVLKISSDDGLKHEILFER